MARPAATPTPRAGRPKTAAASRPTRGLDSAAEAGVWLAAGVRTPFTRVGGALAKRDALELSTPVVKAMLAKGARPDLMVWGAVIPNLTISNLAREVLIEAGGDPIDPGLLDGDGLFDQHGRRVRGGRHARRRTGRSLALVGGAESMSRIQIGLGQACPTTCATSWRPAPWRTAGRRCAALKPGDVQLFIPAVKNRVTGKSHGRAHRGRWPRVGRSPAPSRTKSRSPATAARRPPGIADSSTTWCCAWTTWAATPPRGPTPRWRSWRSCAPAFDRTSGQGTLTAGNSSPLTDGAASVWVATAAGPGAAARRDAARPAGGLRGQRHRPLRRVPPDGAGLCDPAAAGPQRPDLRGRRPVGDPRGLRRPGGDPHQGAAGPDIPARTRPG